MSKKVKVDDLAKEIISAIEDYSSLVAKDVKEAVMQGAETTVKEIKKNAPRDTGKYARSWVAEVQKENMSGKQVVVHSKNRYQLTHLLENGHAKRGGGRTEGEKTEAIPHIAPAEQKGIEVYEKAIERALKG